MLNYVFAPMMRHDTLLGVCQAIGDDFGFNANWLRLALTVPLFFAPGATFGLYLGAGVAVYLVRTIAGWPRIAKADAAPATALPERANDAAEPELPLAA